MNFSRYFITAATLLLLCFSANGQVPVSIAPPLRFQAIDGNGHPYASGCLFSYTAGTNTPAATYQDSTGTATNTNPTILDAMGEADIWIPNSAYKFKLVSAGGINCVTGSTIWTRDGITGVLGLLNLANTFTGSNTFTQPVTITPNSNQLVIGNPGNQTTLNFPAPAGNIVQNMLNVADTYVGIATAQTLTNKTITNPTLTLSGVTITGGPATYSVGVNEGVTGTALNQLVKLSTAAVGTVLHPSITDTGGVVGICVANCGTTGSATIESGGVVVCAFENATTSGDYVGIGTATAGDCRDVGATYPTSGQIIGRVPSTNGAAGNYSIYLFGPEIKAPLGVNAACTNFTPVTVTNTNVASNLQSCTIPANTLQQGSLLQVDIVGVETTAAAMIFNISTSLGGGQTCTTGTAAATGLFANRPWNVSVKFVVLTAGAAGTANMSCEFFDPTDSGGNQGPIGTVGIPTFAINTTIANTLQITEIMTVANPGNSVTGQLLKAVVF